MHSIFMLQLMGDIRTIFAATGRNDTIIAAIATAISITEIPQLLVPGIPINSLFVFGEMTGIAHPVFIKHDSRALVRNNTAGAIGNIGGKVVAINDVNFLVCWHVALTHIIALEIDFGICFEKPSSALENYWRIECEHRNYKFLTNNV